MPILYLLNYYCGQESNHFFLKMITVKDAKRMPAQGMAGMCFFPFFWVNM